MFKNLFFISSLGVFLIGCGISANVKVNVSNGYCPTTESPNISNGGNPYCVMVQLVNNESGQNYINSSNYPVKGLTINVTGAGNILTPTNNSSMDPNNCTGSTINPGSSCTFYLKIGNESYAVNTAESVAVNISYYINNTLFGGTSGNKYYSYNFNLYQYTSIYLAQQNGYLWIHNAGGNSYGWAESSDQVTSLAVDTNAYGILYFGGLVGIYPFGPSNYTASKSITNSGAMSSGTNNLYTTSGNLFALGLSGSTGIWSYGLSKQSWNSTSAVNSLTQTVNPNANAVSTSGVPYVAINNQVFACPNSSSSTSNNCQTEGNALPSPVTKLAYNLSTQSPYTGLYAGTSSGLYIESGTTPSSALAFWTPITTNISPTINVTSMVSNNGNLFIGDNSGNIWLILNTNPTAPMLFANIPGNQAITNMIIDIPGNTLYFTQGASALLSCSLNQVTCTAPTAVNTVLPSLRTDSPVMGLAIGSVLTESVVPFYNAI